MRSLILLGVLLVAAWTPGPASAQKRWSEEEFQKAKPAVGDLLPNLTVYAPDGKEVTLSSLRGHHVVLTFGCLT